MRKRALDNLLSWSVVASSEAALKLLDPTSLLAATRNVYAVLGCKLQIKTLKLILSTSKGF